jgi:hypothetical protein
MTDEQEQIGIAADEWFYSAVKNIRITFWRDTLTDNLAVMDNLRGAFLDATILLDFDTQDPSVTITGVSDRDALAIATEAIMEIVNNDWTAKQAEEWIQETTYEFARVNL